MNHSGPMKSSVFGITYGRKMLNDHAHIVNKQPMMFNNSDATESQYDSSYVKSEKFTDFQ